MTKPGKFWVYEQVMRIPYYGIYQVSNGTFEMYNLVNTQYEKMTPNQRGHYPILPMQVESGLWQGTVLNQPEQLWLRWWDVDGNLLLTGHEQAEQERREKEQALQQLEQERQKQQQLAERLKSLTPEQLQALGIDAQMLD